MKLELCYKETVYKTYNRTDCDNRKEHHEKRHCVEVREHFVCIARHLQKRSRNAGGKTYASTCGNIRTGKSNTTYDTESYRKFCGSERNNVYY